MIVAILFLDVQGYSKINDDARYREFVRSVLKDIAGFFRRAIVKNTWGDAVFAIFPDAKSAAVAALGVRDYFRNKEWDHSLADIRARIGTHVGSAYQINDPLTGRPGFVGRQINLAARIEPVTPPNEVFATHEFKTMLDQEDTTYRCIDAGEFELPKMPGIPRRLFCLKRDQEKEEINMPNEIS